MNGNADGGMDGMDEVTRGVSGMLDGLGERERREPDAGFERRIARATRPGVAGRVTPPRGRRRSPGWLVLPAAAALLLGVFVVWVQRSGPTPAGGGIVQLVWDENDVDDFLFIDGLWDQSSIASGDGADAATGRSEAEEQPADELLYDVLEGGTT